MTTSNHLALTIKLKLILGLIYLGLFGSILIVPMYIFSPDQIVLGASSGADERYILMIRLLGVVVGLILSVFAMAIIYSIHKRENQTALLFVIYAILIYGLSDFASFGSSSDVSSLADAVSSVVFVAIDIMIAVFLLQSKEATSLLKHKSTLLGFIKKR